MKKLHKMLIKDFIPTLIIALLFFILILELVDLFGNLWRYLNANIGIRSILKISLYYLPKCISFSLPIALLFATAYTLGNYYANNELIAIFGSGLSLIRFVMPLLLGAILLSFASFFFEDRVVIPLYKEKTNFTNASLGQEVSLSNANITVLSENNSIVYIADYYNDKKQTLSRITVLMLDKGGVLSKRVDSSKGFWDKDGLGFENARVFTYEKEKGQFTESVYSLYRDAKLIEPPQSFKRVNKKVDSMKIAEAKEWIAFLKRTGLPYKGALTEYYQRFSFSLTPLIVMIISCSLGGRFKKNILLMSLLFSLVISVVYYVLQMVMVLLAKLGYVPPLYGAWAAFVLFFIGAIGLLKSAKT